MRSGGVWEWKSEEWRGMGSGEVRCVEGWEVWRGERCGGVGGVER